MPVFNIDKALALPQIFNVMHQALDELYAKREEEFRKNDPVEKLYKFYPLNGISKSFGSSIGFKQAFERTSDYASYPSFTNADGFKTTVSYVPVNGKLTFTWQTMLESDVNAVREVLDSWQFTWHRQFCELAMFATTAFFKGTATDPVSKIKLSIYSADTVDGDPMGQVHNTVFSSAHAIVRTEGMTDAEFNAAKQSNKFYADIKLDGTDPLGPAKLANVLYQMKVYQNKLKDDNNKLAGLRGRKLIMATEDATLMQALSMVNESVTWSNGTQEQMNPMKGMFDTYYTAYLDGNANQAIPMFRSDASGAGPKCLMMLDPEWNKVNNGPTIVERIKFTVDALKSKDPEGLHYLGKWAFDFACPAWQGISCLYLGVPAGTTGDWDDVATFTQLTPTVFPSSYTATVTV